MINPCPPGQIFSNQFRKRQIRVVHTGAGTGHRYIYILRHASHASLPFPQSRSQRQRSFCSETEITNLWKNPKKKRLYDWPIKSCSSYANFFANQKTVSKLVWFWQVICVHTNLIRLKTVKKNVYFDKFRNHATMTFCSKFPFGLFLKVISMLFFKEMLYIHLCYWTFQIFI